MYIYIYRERVYFWMERIVVEDFDGPHFDTIGCVPSLYDCVCAFLVALFEISFLLKRPNLWRFLFFLSLYDVCVQSVALSCWLFLISTQMAKEQAVQGA